MQQRATRFKIVSSTLLRPALLRSIAAGALLLAGASATGVLLAEPGSLRVVPIPLPVADSGIALAPANAAAAGVPSAPGAWGGARSGSEPTLSERVVDYRIDATLDPFRHTVAGKQTLTWRNRSAVEVRSVYLHLYMNAFESADSTYFSEQRQRGGVRAASPIKDGEWGHIALRAVAQGALAVPWSFVHPDGGPAADHTVVRLDLPVPVAGGASTTLSIDFLTKLPRVVARTGYFGSFHLVGQWFPKIGVLELAGERGATAPRWNVHEFHPESEFYADFGKYDVRLTAPKDYTVGATGERQGAPVEHDGLLTHHFVQGDVHDFAWTADNRSARPLLGSWRGAGSPDVTVTVIYPPEYAASAAPALQAAKDALSYFSASLGPYPYPTLTVVIPPYNAGAAGGMEYPTFFTAEGYRQVPAGSLDATLLDLVTIHEFGHGYFYGILASNEFEEPMLDEGLNEFWDARMLRARGQNLHASTALMRAIGISPQFKIFDVERMASPREDVADAPAQNAWHRLQGIGPVYSRTATVMRDLEARIGKDALERAFKEYYRRWKFRHPSVADFREVLAESSGQRGVVEAVFAQQIYRAGKVDDRVDALTSVEQLPQPGTRQVNGVWLEENRKALDQRIDAARAQWKKSHLGAAGDSGPYPFVTTVTLRRRGAQVPQTVLVRFADGSAETASWDSAESWQQFRWTRPAKAVSAQLDPQRLHYLDVNKLDDSRTIEADARASRRWSADFAALVQMLLSLIANV
ncbi:MAG: M1 family metallopeptidase [Pseudomonadota bacterium]|nr:M1 family metallopeptidase [Pseudomonadota bacterium]